MNQQIVLRNLLEKESTIQIRVERNSMFPLLRDNDKIVIQRVNSNSKLQLGFVYLFEQNKQLVVHRLIKVKQDNYLFKGDCNKVPDSYVKKSAILAKVLFRRKNNKFQTLIHHPFIRKIYVYFQKISYVNIVLRKIYFKMNRQKS